MTDKHTELLDAAHGVLPLLEASTDQYDALKKAEGMSPREASDYLRRMTDSPSSKR